METDSSGKHVCSSRSCYSYSAGSGSAIGNYSDACPRRGSWRLQSLGHPFTCCATCWWCGDEVFFHTNGNGDCVLFDELGWPWQIHSCWESHKEESGRQAGISRLEYLVELKGYDGSADGGRQLSSRLTKLLSGIVPNRPSTDLTLCTAERRRVGASAGGKTWERANLTAPKVSSRHPLAPKVSSRHPLAPKVSSRHPLAPKVSSRHPLYLAALGRCLLSEAQGLRTTFQGLRITIANSG